jgi:hypothetical protein
MDHWQVPHIRPQHVVDSALRLSDDGVRDVDNAAIHGVAVKTIRRWRREYQRRGKMRGQVRTSTPCPRCDGAELDEAAYAELLGWYLGDGHISRGRRDVYNLHIYNDKKYQELNQHIQELMRRVKPGGRPHTRQVQGCINTTVGWKHWICLFPQHGPGRKDLRPIVLEPWQVSIVASHPGDFLRGLFHSDGCRITNWCTQVVAGQLKRYEYPRYMFSNASEDILRLCTWALDLIGAKWTRPRTRNISVARMESVALLDVHVGPKR